MSATPLRSLRITDALWHAALYRAAADGTDVSTVVRELLTDWAADYLRPIEPKE